MKAWRKVGLLALVLVMVFGATVVTASTGNRSIDAVFQDLKLVIRGAQVTSQDEPFIYNGRTYVPLRAVAEALGEEVKYDGATKTVYIGKLPVGDTYLSAMEPFSVLNKESYYIDKYSPTEPFTMGGKRYGLTGLGFWVSFMTQNTEATYNLNGRFKSLTGLIGLDDSKNLYPARVEIYGDDQKLTEFKLTPGELPKEFNLNVQSVLAMKIIVHNMGPTVGSEDRMGTRVNFVNALLHP